LYVELNDKAAHQVVGPSDLCNLSAIVDRGPSDEKEIIRTVVPWQFA
jgi:hypothetical protein